MTINFINDGGAFTFAYDESDILHAEELLRNRFLEIQGCCYPALNKSWKCTKLCAFGKNAYPGAGINPKTQEPYTICEYINQTTSTEGYEKSISKHMYPKHDIGYYEEPG
jgi:hypothetical protein